MYNIIIIGVGEVEVMSGYADLHVHSTASDGKKEPAELVRNAAKKGLMAFALTDHDTTKGIDEAIKEGKEYGVEVIPGIEVTAEVNPEILGLDINDNFRKLNLEVHVLGLYINHNSTKFQHKLKTLKEGRITRIVRVIDKLRNNGININREEVLKKAVKLKTDRIDNAICELLIEKGYAKNYQEGYNTYLREHKVPWSKNTQMTVEEAVDLINTGNGVPILAHPGLYEDLIGKTPKEMERAIINFKKIGIRGIEVYHSKHNESITKILEDIAIKHDFIISGGSDHHGDDIDHEGNDTRLGSVKVNYKVLERLKEATSSFRNIVY